MQSVHQFFAHVAESIGGRLDRTVDALEIGTTLAMPNARIVASVAELVALGWIEEIPDPPYAQIPVRLTPKGQLHWQRRTHSH